MEHYINRAVNNEILFHPKEWSFAEKNNHSKMLSVIFDKMYFWCKKAEEILNILKCKSSFLCILHR